MINERRQVDLEKVIGHVAILMEDRQNFNLCHSELCGRVDKLAEAVDELKPKPTRTIAVILAVIVPLISAIFGYGQLSAKVGETELKVKERAESIHEIEVGIRSVDQRVTRLEEAMKRIEVMDKKIDKLMDVVASRGRWAP